MIIRESVDEQMAFFLYEKGEMVRVNGGERQALIIDAMDKISYYDDKVIRSQDKLQTGDLIDYQERKHLLISQVDQNPHSYRGKMRACNNRLAFNWQGNIKWFDAIIEAQDFSVDAGTKIIIPTGNIYVYMQDNTETRDIQLDQRFYHTHRPFKVEGIDRSMNGLIKLHAVLDSISSEDDVANNIAERWRYETVHTYALTINNGETANVLLHDILRLTCTVTDNGSTVANPNVTFISSDPGVVSVDNQGYMMGISPGQAVITAKLTYEPQVFDSITVTTVENVTHAYTIVITGSPTIKKGLSGSYVASFFDFGTEVFDQSGTWTVKNQDGSTPTMASITASTGNSVTIKAGSQSSYVGKSIILTCTLVSDPTVKAEKLIQIQNIF